MIALLDHLWQSTLFGAGVWLITLALASNRAAVRYVLWFAASLKFLVPFALLFMLGEWFGLPRSYAPPDAPSPLGAALEIAAPVIAPIASHAAGGGVALLPALAGFAWIFGAIVVGSRWLAAWRRGNAMVRAATPVDVSVELDVRASQDAGEPSVARVFRPVVLLPAGLLESLARDELKSVLAHEREHILRRDNLKASVHMLVQALFWFHPLVWWIGRRMVDERERACDEAVVDGGHEGRHYASSILAVCRHCVAGRRVPAAISALSGDLPRRILRIVSGSEPAALGFVKSMTLSTLALAMIAIPFTAGAMTDDLARRQAFVLNLIALANADVEIAPAAGDPRARHRIFADATGVHIENSTLRDLVAAAYDVEPWQIRATDSLDSGRYDIRAVATAPVADPERLDPVALRSLVSKVLASRFSLEVYVNNRCQAPCGRHAAASPNP